MDTNLLIYTNISELLDSCLKGYRDFLESLEKDEVDKINILLKNDPICISYNGMDVPVESIDLKGNLYGRDEEDNDILLIYFFSDLDIYSVIDFHNKLKSLLENKYILRRYCK